MLSMGVVVIHRQAALMSLKASDCTAVAVCCHIQLPCLPAKPEPLQCLQLPAVGWPPKLAFVVAHGSMHVSGKQGIVGACLLWVCQLGSNSCGCAGQVCAETLALQSACFAGLYHRF